VSPFERRVAALALALVALPAMVGLAIARAPWRTPHDASSPRAARLLEASLLARRDQQRVAVETLAAHPTLLTQRGPEVPSLRSAQLVDARGTVLASWERGAPPPRCAPRVLQHVSEPRLVATFDDDCELVEALALSHAPHTPEGAPWGLAALWMLAGSALASLVAQRTAAGLTRRVAALELAAGRVGAGDLTARVRAHGDALDPAARAFNQMAEELSLARERVDYLQRLAGWQDMARRLAHEIKNPLTPIQLAVQEVARRYAGDDAKYKRALDTAREVVEEEVATLRRLVTAFSEFARLPDVKPAPGDLAEFVRDMESSRQFLDEAAGEAGRAVTLHFAPGDEAIPVMLDRIMLRRAFENLVRNAAQAIGARGGNVWVRAERRRVTVTADGSAPEEVDQAWLVIEDDGPGISKDHQQKVFDPYFTTRSEGTGLGLAIVRKIAIDHAGDVGLEDRPGGGARFVFTLPLRDPSRRQRMSFVTFTRNS
jgi:two-component system, NtrC family, nitrogen regulation sensor histidine kinase NtrY